MKKMSILIKDGAWDLIKKDNGEYMFYSSKAEIFIHVDSLKFSTNDRINTFLQFYLKEAYIGCIWIKNEGDRLAIEGLMAL